MSTWRRLDDCWCLWPSRPTAVVDFIGGSYLAATPQISYRRLLEGLASRNLAVHAWSYVPGLDHQLQARQAWDSLRKCRRQLQNRLGTRLDPSLRLGHSLGCKLHLLAPDGGRSSKAMVALSFNNFTADQSIPLLGAVETRLGLKTEFSPSPQETLRLIERHYHQPTNLVVRFRDDELDQSSSLLTALQTRPHDASETLQLAGDHLTPASAGLRRQLLGDWAEGQQRQQQVEQLQQLIASWAQMGTTASG